MFTYLGNVQDHQYIRIRENGHSGYWDSVYCDIRDIRIREIGCSVKWMFHAIREIRFQEVGVRVIGYFGKRSSYGNCRSGNMTSEKASGSELVRRPATTRTFLCWIREIYTFGYPSKGPEFC
ncbi:4219_t:CDS:2 [Funneliformis geosporum]|nr:4219_t:CDS:2 [Funneliformis geosporum]